MTANEVRSEVVGAVWRVERAIGDHVEPGDIVLIIESMKMEIPVEAPMAGVLVEMRVEPATHVEDGTVLFVLEA